MTIFNTFLQLKFSRMMMGGNSMVVYVDLLILSNFLLDYSLITYTGHITKEKLSVVRLMLGTLVAVSSLSLFFVENDLLYLVLRFLYSLVIIRVAFRFLNLKRYVLNLSIFYVLNFVLAGILLSFNVGNRFIHVSYFDYKIWILLVISFILSNILTYILKISLFNHQLYTQVKVKLVDKEYEFWGYMDSGNDLLTRSYKPIIFINQHVIKEKIDLEFLISHQIPYFYQTCQLIGQTTQIIAFKPVSFKLFMNHEYRELDVFVSIIEGDHQSLSNYQVILNKNLLF